MKETTRLSVIESDGTMTGKRNPYFPGTIMRLQENSKNGLQSRAGVE